MGKCILSGFFHIGVKESVNTETLNESGLPGTVIQKQIVFTTNQTGERTLPLSLAVTPPSGGLASDIQLKTASAKIKLGNTTITVEFLVAAGAVAEDPADPKTAYGVTLTIGT
jgi:hypothetical protein